MKGFTLFEILVAVMILTFVIGGIFGVLNISTTNYDTNLVKLNLQRQARQGMSWLSREIRQASWNSIIITGPDSDNNYSISFTTPTDTVNRVSYSVTKASVGSNMLWRLQRSYNGTSQTKANWITIPDDSKPNILYFSQPSAKHIVNIKVIPEEIFFSGGKKQTIPFFLTEQVEVRNL